MSEDELKDLAELKDFLRKAEPKCGCCEKLLFINHSGNKLRSIFMPWTTICETCIKEAYERTKQQTP